MKVKFSVTIGNEYEIAEIVEVNENTIKGTGYMPRNTLNNMVEKWILDNVQANYQIIDDRFKNEINNMPYVDTYTERKFGWIK